MTTLFKVFFTFSVYPIYHQLSRKQYIDSRLTAIVQILRIKNMKTPTLNLSQGKFYTISTHLHSNTNKIKHKFLLLAKRFISKVRTGYILTHSTSLCSPTICKKLLTFCVKRRAILIKRTKPKPCAAQVGGEAIRLRHSGESSRCCSARQPEGCHSHRLNGPGTPRRAHRLFQNLFVIDTKTDYTRE